MKLRSTQMARRPVRPAGFLRTVLLAGLFCLVLSPSAVQAQSVAWEYQVINAKLNNRLLERLLNDQAAQGWELVQITDRGMAIFKKKKR